MRALKLLVIPILLLAPKAWAQSGILCRGVDFAMDSAGFDFGIIPAGVERDTSLIVVNYNCDYISLKGIYTRPPFHCDTILLDTTNWYYGWKRAAIPIGKSGKITIQPGDTAIFLIRFEPSEAGDYHEHIVVDTLDLLPGVAKVDTTNIEISLRGVALPVASVSASRNQDSLELVSYPNPATEVASIFYDLPSPGQAEISIYTVAGSQVLSLENSYQLAGAHILPFSTRVLAEGEYFCRLMTTSDDGKVHSASCKLVVKK